jgi:hypothetical protein
MESSGKQDTIFVDRLPFSLAYLTDLESGNHIVLFYDNLVVAAEYFCAYVEEAIHQQEPTCFVGLPRELYERLFEQVGVRVRILENCGFIKHLSIKDYCLEDGVFSKPKMLQSIENFLTISKQSNSRGARFIILSGSLLDYISAEELKECERAMDKRPSLTVSAMCSYDVRKLLETNPALFSEVMKAHGHCLFQAIAMPTSTLIEACTPRSTPMLEAVNRFR